MSASSHSIYSVLVVGNNPVELMGDYSAGKKVEPYVKYRYEDAKTLQENAIKLLNVLIDGYKEKGFSEFQRDYFKNNLDQFSSMSSFEYYTMLTEGMQYDKDGNAISDENPEGKWALYEVGKDKSPSFILKDGTESKKTRYGEVDWIRTHLNPDAGKQFKTAWELMVDGREPVDEEENRLKKNWEAGKMYFNNFKTADEMILFNTSFWTYAYLDKDGWIDVDTEKDSSEWVVGFYDRFLAKLGEDELMTVFEYTRPNH